MTCLSCFPFPAGDFQWSNLNGSQGQLPLRPYTSSSHINSRSYRLLFSLAMKSISSLLPICNFIVAVCLTAFLDSALYSSIFIRMLYHMFQFKGQVLIISNICLEKYPELASCLWYFLQNQKLKKNNFAENFTDFLLNSFCFSYFITLQHEFGNR